MKPTKGELIKAIHACINSYDGEYGKVVPNLFDAPEQRIKYYK
jgi:hypothetical protein